MTQFDKLITLALQGNRRTDRTGVGTRSFFGAQIAFDHRTHGFPLLTTKNTNFNAIKKELLWFISGSTNINDLDSKIWDEWADENGDVGPVYGKQWRSWDVPYGNLADIPQGVLMDQPIDQLSQVIDSIKTNPFSRRHIINSWNVADLEKMNLPPCHYAMQFYVHDDEHLSVMVHQRSADLMLGVPFNIASYSLLLKMVAQVTGLNPAKHIHTFGDLHIYENHVDAARELLTRGHHPSPSVELNPDIDNIDDFKLDDITLTEYKSHPAIKLPVAV